jgi:hypothetical protein
MRVGKIEITKQVVPDEWYTPLPDTEDDSDRPHYGVFARITITYEMVNRDGTEMTTYLDTPGVWGVDVDGNDPYTDELFGEEAALAAEMVTALKCTAEMPTLPHDVGRRAKYAFLRSSGLSTTSSIVEQV